MTVWHLKTSSGLVPLTPHFGSTWAPWVTLPPQPGPHTLHYVAGRFYIGAGDWTTNLGPTDVVSVGLDGNVSTDLAGVPVDALNCYREIGGAIYAPYTDPRGPDRGGYATNAGGTWHTVEFTSTLMVHCFDMAATSHGLWMTGSTDRADGTTVPAVLLSTDGGETWTVKHTGERGSMARYYGIHVDGDSVYVREGTSPLLTSSDGGETWTESDAIVPPLGSQGYNWPEAYRAVDPTPEQLALRTWTPPLPPGGAYPTVVGEHAYVVAPDGNGWSIYRRPAPTIEVTS